MAVRESAYEPGQGVLVRGELLVVCDLTSGIVRSDGEEVVGEPTPAEGGVAGFLEQGVVARRKAWSTVVPWDRKTVRA
ncbi:MAG: hypothetical protein ACYDB3_11845 [Acidimicrobiales bacterium]